MTALYGLLHDVPTFAATSARGPFSAKPAPDRAPRQGSPAPALLLSWNPGALSGAMDQLIATHPEAFSGPNALPADPVPFRLAVLDAEVPPPIQLHPRMDQALSGFVREQARGVPFNAGNRHYKDRHPKFEVAVALTPLQVLSGQRTSDELQTLAQGLDVPWLRSLVTFRHEDPIHAILRMTESERTRALSETHAAVARYIASAPESAADAAVMTDAVTVVQRLEELFPGDAGILLAVCMKLVRLEPGQGMVTPAGCLHTYLSGKALLVMGTSGNSLTAGLTHDYVDVGELQGLLREGQPGPSPLPVVPVGPGEGQVPLWSSDLDLRHIVSSGEDREVRLNRFSVVLATLEPVVITVGDVTTRIEPGSSVLYLGDPATARVQGPSDLFIASRA